MMQTKRALGIATIVSVAVVFLFLTSAAAPAMSSNQANAFTTQANLLPIPVLNTNVTWSQFYQGWNELEYNNTTKDTILNATPSQMIHNPITVEPTDIESYGTLQNDIIGTSHWNNTGAWSEGGLTSLSTAILGKSTIIKGIITPSNENATTPYMKAPRVNVSDYPFNQLQYDYITGIISFTGKNITGAYIQIEEQNQTGKYGNFPNNTLYPGNSVFFSLPMSDLAGASFNTSGKGYSSYFNTLINIFIPSNQEGNTWTVTVSGLAVTSSQMNLGILASGKAITNALNPSMEQFHPSFPWQAVLNNGYSVAVSQPLQNVTTSQNAISDGNYIEQVEYQGQFELPTAPDLSYGQANISEQFNVSTSQTQVLDINGVSYLSAISGKNGTITLLSSVNPNSQTQFLQIVDYTQSQWNSISSPPGIFSIAGIEYYWWIAVGGLATLIGLAGAAKHAGTKADQERIRRGGGGR
jgi:hypothetical protein